MKIEALLLSEIDQLSGIQPEGWPSILPQFEFYTTSNICLPLKVVDDNEIIGVRTTIIHQKCAWLAHIIVHSNHRNKGIGKIITQKLIEQAHTNNCETIQLVATELGSYVYKKLGFQTTSEYLFYKVSINSAKYQNSNFIVPYTESYKYQILELDNKISGENRTDTINQHLENAILFLRNGKVEGYFMPTFGEGLIIANSKIAGLELLKIRLNTHENVIVPINNHSVIEYMKNKDYDIYYRAKRMYLGKKPSVDLSKIFGRIGGNLG